MSCDSLVSVVVRGAWPACHVSVENSGTLLQRFEPVLICPVTSVSPQAPHAEQDFSADSLLTTFDRRFMAC